MFQNNHSNREFLLNSVKLGITPLILSAGLLTPVVKSEEVFGPPLPSAARDVEERTSPLERYRALRELTQKPTLQPWDTPGHKDFWVGETLNYFTDPSFPERRIELNKYYDQARILRDLYQDQSEYAKPIPMPNTQAKLLRDSVDGYFENQSETKQFQRRPSGEGLVELLASGVGSGEGALFGASGEAIRNIYKGIQYSGDSLDLERQLIRALNDDAEGKVEFLYQLSKESVELGNDGRYVASTRYKGDFAEAIDIAVSSHTGTMFSQSQHEMLKVKQDNLSSQVDGINKRLDTETNIVEKEALSLEKKAKLMLIQLCELEIQSVKTGNPIKQADLQKLAVLFQNKINSRTKQSIKSYVETAKRLNKSEECPELRQAEFKAYSNFSRSLSRLGNSINCPEIGAIGEIASSLLDFSKQLEAAENLCINGSRAVGILEGLSASMNLGLGMFSAFSSIFGGQQNLDPIILKNVIEMRKELRAMRQEMHYEFKEVNIHLSIIHTSLLEELEKINMRLNVFDGKIDHIHAALAKQDAYMSVLSGRITESTDAIAKQIQATTLTRAISIKTGTVTYDNFKKAMDDLYLGAIGQAISSTFTATEVFPNDKQGFFKSILRDGILDKPTDQIVGTLLQEYQQFGHTQNNSNFSMGPINPTIWNLCTLHYIALSSEYPQHYKKYVKNIREDVSKLRLKQIVDVGERYFGNLENIDQELLIRTFQEYQAGSLGLLKAFSDVHSKSNYGGLSHDVNWNEISKDTDSARAEIKRSTQELLKNYSYQTTLNPIRVEYNEFLLREEANTPYDFAAPDDLDIALKENYAVFLLAEKLGLGKINVSVSQVAWTDETIEPHPNKGLSYHYHFIKAKLFVTLKGEFRYSDNEGEEQSITLFNKTRTNENLEYIGDIRFNDRVETSERWIEIFVSLDRMKHSQMSSLFPNIYTLNPSERDESGMKAMQQERISDRETQVHYGMNYDSIETPSGVFPVMKPTSGSKLRQSLDEYWPIMKRDFIANSTDIEKTAKITSADIDILNETYSSLVTPEIPSIFMRLFKTHAYVRVPSSGSTTGESLKKFRLLEEEVLLEKVKSRLADLRESNDSLIKDYLVARKNSFELPSYEIDGTKALLLQFWATKFSSEPNANQNLRLSYLSGVGLPTYAELIDSLQHQLDGKLKSLKYGWYSPEQELAKLKEIEAETDYDPRIKERKLKEFQDELNNSRAQVLMLREILSKERKFLYDPNILSDFSVAEVVRDVENAKILRFTAEDIESLKSIAQVLEEEVLNFKTVNSENDQENIDPVFITPRQELLIRMIWVYKAQTEEKLILRNNTVLEHLLKALSLQEQTNKVHPRKN